jgi:quercetin dioxygenase-like cupin family protein
MEMARTEQNFSVSHAKRGDFKAGGLRSYARYRDLGVAAATNGLAHAQVIRFVPPCTDEVRQLHYHDVQFQMIYVLKGWIRSEFAGEGAHTMRAGSCWVQPPGIRHRVLDYSDDCEVLEVILPAKFDTVMVGKTKRGRRV